MLKLSGLLRLAHSRAADQRTISPRTAHPFAHLTGTAFVSLHGSMMPTGPPGPTVCKKPVKPRGRRLGRQ